MTNNNGKKVYRVRTEYGKKGQYFDAQFVLEDEIENYKVRTMEHLRGDGRNKDVNFRIWQMDYIVDDNATGSISAYTVDGYDPVRVRYERV